MSTVAKVLIDQDELDQNKGSKKRRSTIDPEELLITAPKKKRKVKEYSEKPKKKELIDRAAIKAERLEERRIKGLKIKKTIQAERAELLEALQKNAMPSTDFKFFKSTSKLGQGRLTKKESLRKALAEEKAGLERSEPGIALFKEKDMIVDLTIPIPKNSSADQFLAEHADLVKPKKPKKKKIKAPKAPNAARNMKKKLFTLVESSSDSEGEQRRKSIRRQHMDDNDSYESSVSDIEDSKSEELITTSLRSKIQPESTPKTSKKSQMTQSDSEESSGSDNESVSEPKDLETSKSVPSTSTGFYIPSFATTMKSSTKLSTASSTRRKLERNEVSLNGDSSDSDEEKENLSTAPRGFVIPDFNKLNQAVSSQNGSSPHNSSGESENEGSGQEDEEQDDMMDVEDQEELEMRKRHGQLPERPKLAFSEPNFSLELHALNEPVPLAERVKSKVEKTVYSATVNRTPEINAQRSQLPIIMEEHQIMETIRQNDFVIICGETGSGKTTQVPQFLYEAGFGDSNSPTPGLIGVTEPRRVAAISTAQRVAVELNQPSPSLDDQESVKDLNMKSTPKSNPKRQVAYQVRYDTTTDRYTRIKFMTDGILLREIQSDFLLDKYSAIIIDEAHERTLNTDLLLGLLCRIVPLRSQLYAEKLEALKNGVKQPDGTVKCEDGPVMHPEDAKAKVRSPLKVIIMSATLRVADFVENKRMFPRGPPPVIKIGSRQFPVTIHFNRQTSLANYVEDAFNKVVKIHTKLPPGGILVFLSGQQEIIQLVKMLKKEYQDNNDMLDGDDKLDEESQDDDESSEQDSSSSSEDESESSDEEESVSYDKGSSLDESSDDEDSSSDDEIDMDATLKPAKMKGDKKSSSDEESSRDGVESKKKKKKEKEKEKRVVKDQEEQNEELKVLVMPLYSMLPPKDQMKIFGELAEKTRLIVVATNIAETSLTIPGITYVVDSGRVKSKEYDKSTGMTSYKVSWTSQASADQRAGRAGRTGPGHCYRLFSSAVYQDFSLFSRPDILNIPIEGVVLQMKNMGIEKLETFPFPTPPDTWSLKLAHSTLLNIGALEENPNKSLLGELSITPLGRALVNFPVAPRYAKMLIFAKQAAVDSAEKSASVLPLVIAIVAALAVGDPFLHNLERPTGQPDPRQGLWKAWSSKTSDLLVWLAAIGAYEWADDKDSFCEKYKLHYKTLKEIRLLREQLANIIENTSNSSANQLSTDSDDAKMNTLEEDIDLEETRRKQSFKKSKFDGKITPPTREQKLQIRQIIASGLLDQVAKRYPKMDETGAIVKNRFIYKTATSLQEANLHPNSFLRATPPEYVAYNELIETSGLYLCGITAVSMGWMGALAPWLCKKMDNILPSPAPRYDKTKDCIVGTVEPSFFHSDWTIPKVVMPLQGLDAYKNFAKCFLEGNICQGMKEFGPFLSGNPEIVLKVWTQEKIAALVQPLMSKHIRTREHLYAIWKKDPTFWLSAVALWVSKSKHAQLKAVWPFLPPAPQSGPQTQQRK